MHFGRLSSNRLWIMKMRNCGHYQQKSKVRLWFWPKMFSFTFLKIMKELMFKVGLEQMWKASTKNLRLVVMDINQKCHYMVFGRYWSNCLLKLKVTKYAYFSQTPNIIVLSLDDSSLKTKGLGNWADTYYCRDCESLLCSYLWKLKFIALKI